MFPSFFLLLLSFILLVNANTHSHQIRHYEIAKRHTADVQLHKRFDLTKWTFYVVGLFVIVFSSQLFISL
jgi:uncharacterized membrane protein